MRGCSAPYRPTGKPSILSTVSMVLIVLPSSLLFLWMTGVVGPKIEGVAAFCSPPSRSALMSKNCFTKNLIQSIDSRKPRVASIVQAATSAQMDGNKDIPNFKTKVSSTAEPTRRSGETTSGESTTDASRTDKSGMDDENAGIVGDWEFLHGNWVLRPTFSGDIPGVDDFDLANSQPRAVIHFLGGALVGKAPHITYRYLLEKLAAEGFLIVATPFDLSFDHLETCDGILTKFEAVAPTLAKQYGALPVVGIGHSCGALLQVLISSLFPDTPRAANALLSFNNKPVSEAVPFFEEIFAPLFSSLAVGPEIREGGSNTGDDATTPIRGPSSNDSLTLALKLAKVASQGNLPSDELLQEAQSVFGGGLQAAAASLPLPVPPFFGNNGNQILKIPTGIRESYAEWAKPSVTALGEAGVLPLIHETIVSLEQIPKLINEVADGSRDFNPTPALVRSAAGKAYRPRRTLIVGYKDDPIDESDEIEEVLKEARSITRMRRPMVEIDVERTVLGGGHAAPLIAPPLDVAGRAEDLLGLETSQERLGYSEAVSTVKDLVRWLEDGNL